MIKPAIISYAIITLTVVMAGWFHLGAPLLTILFSYFVLSKLRFIRAKWMAVVLFTAIICGLAYGAAHFINLAIKALPEIADESIPRIISWAKGHGFQLPFTDYESLKALSINSIKAQAHYLRNFANFAHSATTLMVYIIIGVVVAVSLFFNSQLDLDRSRHSIRNNLYSLCCRQISLRFRNFYRSFATVMGAQIVISFINTVLTSVFLISVSMIYAPKLMNYVPLVVGVTFLCGMLPVIGNLISNTIIVGIAFTDSPQMALAALVFLVVIHKLEYFLNSKIIGDRIRNPIWLTLLGLLVGERLMGIPGMILAPVILNYLKIETTKIEVEDKPETSRELQETPRLNLVQQ